MSTAQELAIAIHESGFSDSEAAHLLGITREYFNKVRNGNKAGSAALSDKFQAFLETQFNASTDVYTPDVPTGTSDTTLEAIEILGIPWKTALLIGAVVMLLLIICLTVYLKKKREHEHDQ